jgi:hypothetical protein
VHQFENSLFLKPSLRGGPQLRAEVAIQTIPQTAVFGLFLIATSA